MTDNVVWGIDFSRKPSDPIRTREDAVDELAKQLATMLPEYDLSYSLIDHAKEGAPVEYPADCPA